MKSVPEKDWKAFKRIRARAIERFARRRLKTCRELLDEGDADGVGRMHALAEFFHEESKDLWRLEGHQSRSSILPGLAQFAAFDLLDAADLAELSPGTRATVEGFEPPKDGEA